MVHLGKSKFSKLLAMLLTIAMVLSTMAFTLPVSASGTVLWEEDFTGLTADTVSTAHADWSATITDADGTQGVDAGTFYARATDPTISWADAATVYGPRVAFEDGKVKLMKKRNTYHGGSSVYLSIPMTLNEPHPTTGYTVFEYDYYSDALFYKDRSNEWSIQDVKLMNSASSREYSRISVTSTNGIQDLLDSPVEADGSSYKNSFHLGGYYDTMIAGTHKNNIRQGTDLSGKPVHMQVIYDLVNLKYMICAEVDGEKSFRGNTWMDIPGTVVGYNELAPNISYFIDKVVLQAAEAPEHGSADSVATYDNFKYTHYTALPTFVSSTVNNGDTDVAVSGTIDLEFSQDVDEASINAISLKSGGIEEPVTVAMNGTDGVTVTYSGLSGNVDYTLTVPQTVTSTAGLPLSAEQTINFKTVQTVPTVTSVTPANGATGQLITVTPAVVFSEAMDEETVDNVTLSTKFGNVAVTRTLSSDGKTVTLTPTSSLDAGITYTITVPATVKSLGGTSVTATTSTFTTAKGGTVLWTENFDGLTAGRDGWAASVGNYAGGNLTNNKVNGTTVTWDMAASSYTSKIAFDAGKLVLGQKRNTEHGSEMAMLEIPMTIPTSTGRPSGSGYLIFEYDYYSDAVAIRNRYNERNTGNDLVLTESASGRTYAQLDITSTNGIQDMHGAGTVNSADTYTTIAAGTHKDNIRKGDDIQGKPVHMVLIFDVVNTQYNIFAKVDGEVSFRSTDWIDYTGTQQKDWFFNKITLKQTECNVGTDTWTEVTYDNFVLTQYTTLPAFVSNTIVDTEDVDVTGSFDLSFDTAIDEDSISAISLCAQDSETPDEIDLTMKDAKTVTVNYKNLATSTNYTLTVPKTVVSTAGLPLSQAAEVSFTTNAVAPPAITSATITNGATGITLDKLLRITFSEAMSPQTASGITLKKQDSATNLITGYEWSEGNTVVTLYHDTMEANAQYTLEIPQTVVSATSGLPAIGSYTFTTGDFATNVIWSENFDGLTEGRTGWSALVAYPDPTNGNNVLTKSISAGTLTWAEANNAYPNQIKFINNKFGLIKQNNQSHGGSVANTTIPISTSSTPTTGYTVFEFDYLSTNLPYKDANNYYGYDVLLTNQTNSAPILQLNIDKTHGVQDILNPDAAKTSLAFATVTAAPYLNNICSTDGLLGKKLHFQVVYDVENLKYMISVTPEGDTRIVRNSDWIKLPSDVTKIDFKSVSLQLKSYKSGYGAANTWYDNLKIWSTSELPEVVSSTVSGNPEVSVDHGIVLRFTKAMNLSSLKNITLVANETSVSLTPSLSNGGRTVILSHPQLATGSTYTLTLPVTVTSELGLPVAATSYTFTTTGEVGDSAIESATITNGAKNIELNRELSVNFTAAVTEASVSSITLTKKGESQNLITNYTLSNEGKTVTLAHNDFDESATYVLTVPADVKSQVTGLGIVSPAVYTFTTLGEADTTVLWSENFDGRTAGDGAWRATINSAMSADGTINTSGNTAYNLGKDFTWADSATKYQIEGIAFTDGRLVINKYGKGWHGSNSINVTLPLATEGTPLKDYAVFEFDFFTTSMAQRGADNYHAGDVLLKNTDNVVIAKLQMSKKTGIQDILNTANLNANLSWSAVNGSYKNNICEATDLENKTLHFKVVYDVNNLKYLITMTPEGGATVVRNGGWQSLPANTKIDFSMLVFESKEYPHTGDTVNSQYDNIKFSTVSNSPVLVSTSVDNAPEIGVGNDVVLNFAQAIETASLNGITIKSAADETVELIGVEASNGGKTVTLKHRPFAASTSYTLTVPETVTATTGIPMVEGETRTFTTNSMPAPEVLGATVTDGATNISISKELIVTLSEAFKTDTEKTITLTKKGETTNLITGYTLSNENKSVTLAHNDFELNTEYVLTVPYSVKGATTDCSIVNEMVYNFKTVADALKVVSYSGFTNGETAEVADNISLTFNLEMDLTSLSNVTLVKKSDSTVVALTPSLSTDKLVATFQHAKLEYETEYELTIPVTVRSEGGVYLDNAVKYTFTTEAYDPVFWSEDFTTLPTGVTANTSVSGWYTDGWNSYVQAEGYAEGMNEFKFVDGKLQMTKGQNAATKNKGLLATKTVTGAPTSGVIQLEYDYTISAPYASDAYTPSMAVINTDGKQLLALNFGSAYFGVWVNKIAGAGSALDTVASGGGNEDSSRIFARGGTNATYLSLVDGGVIHVTATINLDEGTYSITLTKDGVDYHTPTGIFDIDPDITNYKVGSVALYANCATTVASETETPVVSTYDNLIFKEVEAAIPTITAAQTADGATGVGLVNDQKLTFSTPMSIKSLDNITLVPTAGGDAIALTPVLAADGKTVTFTHAPLAYNTQYTMTVPTTVKSSTAGALETAVTYTYTTIEAPAALKEGTIWSENFDTLASFTAFSGSWIKIDGTAYSSAEKWADYHNKIELKNGKLTLTKAQEWTSGTDDIQINIPITDIGTLATQGKVSVEFDYKQNIKWSNKYQGGFRVRNLNGKDITIFGFCGDSYGMMDKTHGGSAEDTKQNIGSMVGLPGKNIHFEIIYDLDAKTYTFYYTPEGGVRTQAKQGPQPLLTDAGYDVNFQKFAINVSCVNEAGAEPVVIELDNFAIRNLPAAPVVTETSPADAATNVELDSDITVTFDKAIKEDTIAGVKLFDGETEITEVTRSLSADGKTVTINPNANLENSKTYTIKITTAVIATDNAEVTTEVTKTFTTKAAIVDGTVLWSEDFDDVTIDNVATLHSDWILAITDSDKGTNSSAWADAATYGPKLYFVDGKVKLTDLRNSWHGGTNIKLTIPMTPSETKHSGYTVFEFDYEAPNMTVKNRYNEYDNVDVVLRGRNDGRTYGRMGITSTNGVQDFLGLGSLGNSDAYTNIVAGSAKNNIMSTAGYSGETIHVAYIYDLANMRYMVSATRNGEKSFHGSEWIALTTDNVGPAPSTAWFIGNIDLTLGEAPETGSGLTEVTYDNFKYTHYTADNLPSFVSSSIANGAEGIATDGSIALTFSEEIDPAALAGITLKQGDVAVEVNPTVDGSTVTVPYEKLAGLTQYTLTIPETVTDLKGLPLSAAQAITFTTAKAAAPVVTATSPADAAIDVEVDSDITVTFDKAIKEDTIAGVKLFDGDTEITDVTRSLSADGKTVTINPNANLANSKTYTIKVTTAVIATDNGVLDAEVIKTFTTDSGIFANVQYAFEVKTDKNIYNAGETVTANIVATGEEGFSSFGFDLNFDNTELELTNVTTALAGTFDSNNGRVAFDKASAGEDIALAAEGTVIATATFKVKDGAVAGVKTITLDNAEMTPSGYDGNRKAPTVTAKSINVYNITVTFAAGTGTTLTGATVAYAKYGESKLYTDRTYATEFTVPTATADTANGYNLVDAQKYWAKDAVYYSATEIAAATHNENATYVATASQEYTVTISAGDQGSFANVASTTFKVEPSTMLSTLALPTVGAGEGQPTINVNSGYVFTGWKVGDTETIITPADIATYEITGNIALTAQYTKGIYTWNAPAFDNGSITDLTGVTDGKVKYTEDVTFKVTPAANSVVKTVTYQIGTGAPSELIAVGDTYTIDGDLLVADVTINVVVLKYYTVTFSAGTGTTFASKTAYVLDGSAGMYADLASLKAQGTPNFVLPALTSANAEDGYRLAADTALEPLWFDGAEGYETTAGFADKTFSANKAYTAVAIKQYTVTFAIGGNGTFAEDAVTEVKVDAGKKVSAVPEVVANTGYVFKEWQKDGALVTVTDEVIDADTTFTAVFEKGKYVVNFSKPETVNVDNKVNIDVDNKAEYGTNVTFTLEETGSVVITGVTYQVTGGEVKPLTAVDGVYTIPGSEITNTVTVTVTTNSVYTVSFTTDGNGTVSTSSAVVHHGQTIAEIPTTTPNTGYEFAGWVDGTTNEPVDIEAAITGDVTYKATFILATREITKPANVTLTFDPDYNEVQYGKDVKFTVSSTSGVITEVQYKVGAGDYVTLTAVNGVYTILGTNITANIDITVTEIAGATATVVTSDYKLVNVAEVASKRMFVLETDKLTGEHYEFADGTELLWSDRYNAYVAWVDNTKSTGSLTADLVVVTGEAEEITSGDVNGDGRLTAADAGIINDCLHGQRSRALSFKQIFAMDIAGNKGGLGYQEVTTNDIMAILLETVQ